MWHTVWYSLPRVLPQPFSPSSLSLPPNSETQTIDSCHNPGFSQSVYWFWMSALPARAPCLQAASPPHTDPLGYPWPGASTLWGEDRAAWAHTAPTAFHKVPQDFRRFQPVQGSQVAGWGGPSITIRLFWWEMQLLATPSLFYPWLSLWRDPPASISAHELFHHNFSSPLRTEFQLSAVKKYTNR